MKKKYLDRLKDGILLYNGAMGTMLYGKGIFLNRCFEEVCLSSPEIVRDIHNAYIDAGAQAIITNTFGANISNLSGYGLEKKAEDIISAAVSIAREAAGEEIYVAGSIGPIGAGIKPFGQLSHDKASKIFKTQIESLIKNGVDLLIFETFRNINELLLAVKTAREVSGSIPVQAQFSIGHTGHSEYVKKALHLAKKLDADRNVDVLGVNCTVGPAQMLEILLAIKGHVKKPISIMPNAGYPSEVDGRSIYLTSPDYFGEYSMRFADAGAVIIGGCCGTTPEHIRKMAGTVLSLNIGRKNFEITTTHDSIEEKAPLPLSERSSLGNALAAGKWIKTVELVPPIGTDLSKIIEKSIKLKKHGVDCINIPDGPRASSRISALIAAIEIEKKAGIETVLHFCCRDRNLIAMQADLLGAQAAGLRNMLLITGDPPKVGNYPNVAAVFDVDSIGLLALANRLNHGVDLGGNQLPSQTSLVLGAGTSPVSPAIDVEIERAFQKFEAGAEFFITQTVFDADVLFQFLKKIEKLNVRIIAGVWPLASYRNALFLNNEVPGVIIPERVMERMRKTESKEEARAEGILIAREIIESIKESVSGVQVSPPFGNLQTAVDVISNF